LAFFTKYSKYELFVDLIMSMNVNIRCNIKSIEQKEDELSKLRDAFKVSMACTDNRGYSHIAGFHGVPDFYCWHHQAITGTTVRARIFLPWHRAYLSWLEWHLRDLSMDPTITLAWWDWTSEKDLPNSFKQEFISAGNPNPLFKFHINLPSWNIIRDTTRDIRGDLPTEEQVDDIIYNTPDFEDFEVKIEDVHDTVHGWVGGSMGIVGIAAFDPIFWAHHCMIDRIWYLWQEHNKNFEAGFEQMLDLPLSPFNRTVKTVLDIRRLGYEYADDIAEVYA
jgi:tyrosinase